MTAGRFSTEENTFVPEDGTTPCMLAPPMPWPSNVKHCRTSRFSPAERGKVREQSRRRARGGRRGWRRQPDHNPSD